MVGDTKDPDSESSCFSFDVTASLARCHCERAANDVALAVVERLELNGER